MACIPSIGRPVPTALMRAACDAFAAIAVELSRIGLGTHARIHGSAATKALSFLDWSPTPLLAGDVDVLVMAPLSPSDVSGLQTSLTSIYQVALGPHGGGHSHVSVKSLDLQFLATLEAEGLLKSAWHGGLTATALARRQNIVPARTSRVIFPYALQYATWRYVSSAGSGPLDQLVGLYELCKGVSRHIEPHVPTNLARLFTRSDLARFAERHLFLPRQYFGGRTSQFIRDTVGANSDTRVGVYRRWQALEDVRHAIQSRMPGSILLQRARNHSRRAVA